MDLSSVNPASNAAVSAGARPAAAQSPLPDVATRLARFDELSSTVLGGSARASEDQQLAAYQALQAMQASGQLVGLEDDRKKVLDQATFDSEIGRRAQDLSKGFVQQVNAAVAAGGPAAALKAAAGAFDSLSTGDQKVLFGATLNPADRNGDRPHADPQAWRDNTAAQIKMVDYMRGAGVVGANGRLDHKAAAAKAGDAKFSAALRLSLRSDNTSPDWTKSVLGLFGADRSADRVELSPAAREYVANQPASAPSTQPATAPETPYRAGTLVSRVA